MNYEIMHMDRRVASIDSNGRCKIYYPSFMPFNLFFESRTEVDALVNNLTNFQYWCATRVLTLDRQYAKEILNSLGLKQAMNDRDRAKIALTYRCLSLTDVYWVRIKGEKVQFAEVNLYENHLDNTFIDISLKGRQYTANNETLARDLSTNGVFPKAWRRTDHGFQLLKDGGDEAVAREILASRISRCFDVDQVLYEIGYFSDMPVSVSNILTSVEYSIAPMSSLELFLINKNRDIKKFVLKLDAKNYHMMNIIDYLVGNTDRHWGNWGVLVDNKSNRPVKLHPLMDFNQAFMRYEDAEGANCQTCFGRKLTQKEAAIEGVKAVGLNQLRDIDMGLFEGCPELASVFEARYNALRTVAISE